MSKTILSFSKLKTTTSTEGNPLTHHRIIKCAYTKPELLVYGDVRDLTLGGSPGGGDSGTPTTRRRR